LRNIDFSVFGNRSEAGNANPRPEEGRPGGNSEGSSHGYRAWRARDDGRHRESKCIQHRAAREQGFVKPIEEDAETNLFIWTTAGRFAYELVPASGIEQMHFAIDQPPIPQVVKAQAKIEIPSKPAPIPVEMLTKARPILLQGDRQTHGRVEIELRDLYRDGDRLYLRYAMLNQSAHDYQTARPNAFRLIGVRSPVSLIPFPDHQLSERLGRSIKADGQILLKVVDANQIARVDAGGEGFGWIAIEQSGSESSVLRLDFGADDRGPVDAVLVLGPENVRKEAANAGSGIE
jgi:hypothetical protein